MRIIVLRHRKLLAAFAALLLALPVAIRPLAAQGTMLSPEESAVKARQVLNRAIEAFGGDAYLNATDIECTGRFAQFSGSRGDLAGYAPFVDYNKFPDKSRTEYYKQRNIIKVNNGDRVWDLDRGGALEGSVAAGKVFRDGVQTSVDYILRSRLNEPGIILRYGGPDVVDLKQVEWVEVQDTERRTVRIAFETYTGLPLRSVYTYRDDKTRDRYDQVTTYALYHKVQGIQTPFQVLREVNGRKVHQVFYTLCKYNTGVADDFFTKEALEQRFAELNKGKKPK